MLDAGGLTSFLGSINTSDRVDALLGCRSRGYVSANGGFRWDRTLLGTSVLAAVVLVMFPLQPDKCPERTLTSGCRLMSLPKGN